MATTPIARTILFALITLATVSPSMAQLLIAEAYPDPIGTETGGEAVLIWNAGSSAVPLQGWVLRTKSSAADATLPAVSLGPQAGFLIADAGWNASKDNASWPQADHEEPITLGNADGALAIIDPQGLISDSLAWGDPANAPAELIEGTIAPAPKPGQSLRRSMQEGAFVDTDDNQGDFIIGTPTFSASSGNPLEALIDVLISIAGAPLRISDPIVLADDFSAEGVQLIPLPGKRRDIAVVAPIEASDGRASVQSVDIKSGDASAPCELPTGNATSFNATCVLRLDYFTPPDAYSFEIIARAASGTTAAQGEFEVVPASGIGLNTSTLSAQGTKATMDIKVANLGNTVLDLRLRASPFSSGEHEIDAGAVHYRLIAPPQQFEGAFSAHGSALDSNLAPTASAVLQVRIDAPDDTPQGTYRGSIAVVGIP